MLRHNLHNRSSRPQTRSATTPTRTDEEKSSFAGPSFTTLAPVLGKVADTFATFNKKFEKVKEVSDGLSNFNKSFGAFLAGMVVNDAVVKWPHAPTKESIELLKKRTQKKPVVMEIQEPVRTAPSPPQPNPPANQSNAVESNGNGTEVNGNNKRKRKAPAANARPTPAKRRPHTQSIKKIIDKLPLEYREQTEKNKNMQQLLEVLIDNPNGLKMKELAEESTLKQYMVTDCIKILVRNGQVIKEQEPNAYAKYKLDVTKFANL